MTNITTIDPVKDTRWDAFVEAHPHGWLYHLSAWKEILEDSFKHMTGHYIVRLDQSGKIQAGLPLFHVKSWLTGNRLVSVPYATLFDPLVNNQEDMSELWKAATTLSVKLKTSYLEIRTLSESAYLKGEGLKAQSYYKHHYLPLGVGLKKLRSSFDRTCIRQKINRAEKSDLTTRTTSDTTDLDNFYKLYSITRKQHGRPPLPYKFIKNILETLQPSKKAFLLIAEHKQRQVAGLILFKYKNRMSAEYAASDRSMWTLSPNHLLFWEAIKIAVTDGWEIFDFGRTAPDNTGLMNFKKRWGSEICDLPIFFYPKESAKAKDAPHESRGHKIIGKVCTNAPNFILPHIGSFCYRHMG